MNAAALLRALFPGVCVLCRRRSQRDIDLCMECERAFQGNDRACRICAETAVGAAGGRKPPATPAVASGDAPDICGSCLAAPPPWTRTVAAFAYSRPLNTVVEGLKSGNGFRQARILGKLLASAVAIHYAEDAPPTALVPMPLNRARLRQRGYNQADLLAAVVARELGLPRLRGYLARVRGGPPQRSLARSQRLRNVRGAFAARRPLPVRRVALIDDVTTTGATVRAATQALLDGGAQEVHVWVAAKTPTDRSALA